LAVKNIVLCFDVGGDTSATAVLALLEQSDEQVTWYRGDDAGRWQDDPLLAARTAIGAAYEFLSRTWETGDAVIVLGADHGGYCAQALARLLGMVGVLPETWSDLVDFALDAYAVPTTNRSAKDWQLVRRLIGNLNGGNDIAVPVAYLGTWDATRAPGLPAPPADAPANVLAGRHALALADVGPSPQLVPTPSDAIEVVWFRGGHCDLAGGPGACAPLSGIALEWILAGALAAGARLDGAARCAAPAPDHADALATSAYDTWRKLPGDARVHASVEVYLQAHPEYSRRLPSRTAWVDGDWLARGERLVIFQPAASGAPSSPAVATSAS
jgi:hypothetical protein